MSSEIGIEEYRQDVLRVCSYHRSDFALALNRTRPHKIQAIAPLLQTHFTKPSPFKHGPPFRLGVLDLLTSELIINILLQLDIVSYLRFRRVNRHARVIATRLHEYKLVSTHGLEGLTAVLRTGLGEYFGIKDLYDPLVTYSCKVCGDFGHFLYLPDCTRCCFSCLTKAPELHMTSVIYLYDKLAQIVGISRSKLERELRPVLHPVPGKYSLQSYRSCFTGDYLMQTRQLVTILTSLGASERAITQQVDSRAGWESNQFASATAYPWYNAKRAEADRGVSCKGIQLYIERIVPPGRVEPEDERKHRDRVFSRAGFLQHFKTCGLAQDLWARRDNGAAERESWFISNGGGLRKKDEEGVPF